VPEDQNRFSQRYELPPCSVTVEAVCAVLSSRPKRPAASNTGEAKVNSAAVAMMDQTKIGTAPVMPGAGS